VYVLCVCNVCMYCVHVLCVCIVCMYCVYVLCVCIVCAYCVCLCMPVCVRHVNVQQHHAGGRQAAQKLHVVRQTTVYVACVCMYCVCV